MKNTTVMIKSLVDLALAVFKASAIMMIEIFTFCMTLGWGLVLGTTLTYWANYYFSCDPAASMTGPIYIYKEVLWSAVIMLCIIFFVVVPIQRKVVLPLWEDASKKLGFGPDVLFTIIDAYILGFCFAQISILFELRNCKKDFDFEQLNGPIPSFSYMIKNHQGNTGLFYGVGQQKGLEKVMVFPLFAVFAYPIYSFIRSYFIHKTTAFSVTRFIERVLPKPCCCDESEDDYETIDWKAQFCGWLLELVELCVLYLHIMIIISLYIAFAGSVRPGYLFIVCGVLAFLCSMGLSLAEAYFQKPFKCVQNGVETRILLNLAVFVFFVTKNFLVVFEQPKEDVCTEGHMEVKSEISQSFAYYFTISVYAAWKIIFLSVAFSYNIECKIAKAEKLIWGLTKSADGVGLPTLTTEKFVPQDKGMIPKTHVFPGRANKETKSTEVTIENQEGLGQVPAS